MRKDFDRTLGYSFCRKGGMLLALSMMAALSFVSLVRAGDCGKSLTVDSSAKSHRSSDSAYTEITVSEPAETVFDDAGKIEKVCKEYKKRIDREKNIKKQNNSQPTVSSVEEADKAAEDTPSTTSTTQPTVSSEISVTEGTTVTTTVSTTVTTQAASTTSASREPDATEETKVSNGMKPFNYNDVSSIAQDCSTLGDFVEKLSPSVFSWDADEYSEKGCIRIKLESEYGIAVLDVKQTGNSMPGETPTGSMSREESEQWDWLKANSGSGCNISSVTWFSPEFAIAPVRGIGVGSTLARLTDNYLCINGGATTLYKASDIIEDQNKLNAILAAENLYTFVGGKVYSIGSYLDKYYNGKEHTFRFENCDYIVQYGCNSIMEHNYTTGSWIIEYAVMEDTVIGIHFMNKSYYRSEQKTAISTNLPSSGNESGTFVTTYAESSQTPDEFESSALVSVSDEASEPDGATTEFDGTVEEFSSDAAEESAEETEDASEPVV